MSRSYWLGGLVAIILAAGARAEDKVPAKATPLDQMKKLAGTWLMCDEKGQPTDKVMSVYKVTAAGSAVEETIFPGSDHEMVTVYHMSGPSLVLTHYCALGNQPHLKLDPASPKGQLNFKFVSGSNMDVTKDMHMHEGSITVIDDDHIESAWQAWKDGKPDAGHKLAVKLVRKK